MPQAYRQPALHCRCLTAQHVLFEPKLTPLQTSESVNPASAAEARLASILLKSLLGVPHSAGGALPRGTSLGAAQRQGGHPFCSPHLFMNPVPVLFGRRGALDVA